MPERRHLPSWVLAGLGATLLVIVALAFAAWAPALPCPSCVDLGCAVFRCEICGGQGGPGAARSMSLWKRWNAIQALEREGNRKIRWMP